MIVYLILAAAQGVTFSNTVPPQPGPVPVLPPQSLAPGAMQATGILAGPRERIPAPQYFSRDDYPFDAHGAQGAVRFILTIDPTGRVVGCSIGSRAAPQSLMQRRATSCGAARAIIRR